MSSYECRQCGSFSAEQGSCVVCGRSLGSYPKAFIASFISTLALGGIWILMTVLTGLQLTMGALLFGGIISLCCTQFSGGRGVLFQLIATTFTIVGIVAADTIAMVIVNVRLGELDPQFITASWLFEGMKHNFFYDGFTGFFFVLGVMAGLWIWR